MSFRPADDFDAPASSSSAPSSSPSVATLPSHGYKRRVEEDEPRSPERTPEPAPEAAPRAGVREEAAPEERAEKPAAPEPLATEPHLETAELLRDAPPACGLGDEPVPAVVPPPAEPAPPAVAEVPAAPPAPAPEPPAKPRAVPVAERKPEAKKPQSAPVPEPKPEPAPKPERRPEPAPETGFARLGLSAPLLRALVEKGYTDPTPVQAEVIPAILAGRDVLGQAATGTGKTGAFALPLIDRLRIAKTAPDAPEEDDKRPAVFVMAPTRELAAQVAGQFRLYRGEMQVNVLTVVGGEPFGPQLSALRRGVDVVVATPGRALDLCKKGSLDLSGLLACVLDEADEMLDMGFQEEIEAVLDFTPPGRQTVLVSATLAPRIQQIANKHLQDPVRIEIGKPQAAKGEDARVIHSAHFVRRQYKAQAIDRILEVDGAGPCLIFCRTRGGADDLTTELNRCGRRAAALHGGLTQDQRTKVVERLRGGTLNVVVATDVAARGLDVPELTHVMHADLPTGPEPFVHRCGRVGRAGREGRVVTFLHPKERYKLKQFAKAANADVEVSPLPDGSSVVRGRLRKTREALKDAATDPSFAKLRDELTPLLEELGKELNVTPAFMAASAAALGHRTAFGDAPIEDLNSAPPRGNFDGGDRPAGRRFEGNGSDRGGKFGNKSGGKFQKGGKFKGGKREHPTCPPESARLFVSAGRDAGVRPGDLVGAIAGETELSGRDIGAIKITPAFSLVDVPKGAAEMVIQSLSRGSLRGEKVQVRHDREG